MRLEVVADGTWWHGSPLVLQELREGSTITQWQELAACFSHKPDTLCCADDGSILHTGTQKGYLYVVDEPVEWGVDVLPHPRTTMDENAEFLTTRPLRLRLVQLLEPPTLAERAVMLEGIRAMVEAHSSDKKPTG